MNQEHPNTSPISQDKKALRRASSCPNLVVESGDKKPSTSANPDHTGMSPLEIVAHPVWVKSLKRPVFKRMSPSRLRNPDPETFKLSLQPFKPAFKLKKKTKNPVAWDPALARKPPQHIDHDESFVPAPSVADPKASQADGCQKSAAGDAKVDPLLSEKDRLTCLETTVKRISDMLDCLKQEVDTYKVVGEEWVNRAVRRSMRKLRRSLARSIVQEAPSLSQKRLKGRWGSNRRQFAK